MLRIKVAKGTAYSPPESYIRLISQQGFELLRPNLVAPFLS